MTVKIDESKCQGVSNCGACINACVLNMLNIENDKPKPKILGCVECYLCLKACPNDAISK